MESQHRAVLSSVAELINPESIARRDRGELVEICRTLADWLRQYVEIAAEQSAEIHRLEQAHRAFEAEQADDAQGLNSSTA